MNEYDDQYTTEQQIQNINAKQQQLESSNSETSSISSIDDKDLTLLIRGEHRHHFDAKEEFLEIKKTEMAAKKKLLTVRYCFCFKRIKKVHLRKSDMIIDKLGDKIKLDVIIKKEDVEDKEHFKKCSSKETCDKKPAILMKMNSLLSPKQSAPKASHDHSGDHKHKHDHTSEQKSKQDHGSHEKNLEIKQQHSDLQNNMSGVKRKRTGKELWLIAKMLVFEQVRKKDLGFNMMEALRRERMRKQLEIKHKSEEAKKQQMLLMQQAAQNQDMDQMGMTWCDQLEFKFFKLYSRLLLYPDNRRLKYFHLIVAITLFFDFFLTGLIMGNYRFITGKEEDFINHHTNYIYICLIQGVDILLNFFKSDYKMKAKEILINYLKGNFVTDMIAVLPYSLILRPMIFLRYLKLLKYNVYLMYFEDFIIELCKFMSYKQLQIFRSMFRLVFQLSMVSHLFASFWCLIGNYLLESDEGWIYENHLAGIQKKNFVSIYITSIYWVITTFTSIGYGDVYGHSKIEYLYQILVEMVGMCFFGYMIGTFEQLLGDLANDDQFGQEQDKLDQWIIQMNNTVKNRALSPIIFRAVQDYYTMRFKQNPQIIMEDEIFNQLKPRLRRQILDSVFSQFYKAFNIIFQGCELNFQREIFIHSEYTFFHNELEEDEEEGSSIEKKDEEKQEVFERNRVLPCGHTYLEHVWYDKPQAPIILNSGKKSDKIYMILSGQVYIMDPACHLEYGVLYQGSYFGDISLFFDEPNQFSYAYNPYQQYPNIQCLTIDSEKFMRICRKYPLSFEILLNRAYKRKKIFEKYRAISLLQFMKGILKSESLFMKLTQEKPFEERIKIGEFYNLRKNLYQSMYHQYQLQQISYKKNFLRQKLEEHKKQEEQLEEEKGIKKINKINILPVEPEGSKSCSSESDQEVIKQQQKTKQDTLKAHRDSVKANIVNKTQFSFLQTWQRKATMRLDLVKKKQEQGQDKEQNKQPNEKDEKQDQQQIHIEEEEKKEKNVENKNISKQKKQEENQNIFKQSELESNSNDNIMSCSESEDSFKSEMDDSADSEGSIIECSKELLLAPIQQGKPLGEGLMSPSSTVFNQIEENTLKKPKGPRLKSATVRKTQQVKQSGATQITTARPAPSYQVKQPELMKDNFVLKKQISIKSKSSERFAIQSSRALQQRQRGRTPAVIQKSSNVESERNMGFDRKSSKTSNKKSDFGFGKKRADEVVSNSIFPSKKVNSKPSSQYQSREPQLKGSKSKETDHQTSFEEINKNKRKKIKELFYEGGEIKTNQKEKKNDNKKQKFNPQLIVPMNNNQSEPPLNPLRRQATQRIVNKERIQMIAAKKELQLTEKQESNILSAIQETSQMMSITGNKDANDVFGGGCGQSEFDESDLDLEKVVQRQIQYGLRVFFQQKEDEQKGLIDAKYNKQFHQFNRIIEEFIDLNNIKHNSESHSTAEVFFARYLTVIETGSFPKGFIPKHINSVIQSRQKIMKEMNKKMTNQQADILVLKKNLEHIITYKQYQDEQIFQIMHTNHNQDQVKTSQSYIQNSFNRQMYSNKQFKHIYDTRLDRIKADIVKMKERVNSKLQRIIELQQHQLLKKQGLKRQSINRNLPPSVTINKDQVQ